MPYAAAFGRHAARRGARRLLPAALLGLLIAMFTPGFTPPPQASGRCAAVAPADDTDGAGDDASAGLPGGGGPVGVPGDGGGSVGAPGGGDGGPDGAVPGAPRAALAASAGSAGSGMSAGAALPAVTGPSGGGGPACAVPRAIAVPAADPAGHHGGGGHHGGVRRICVASACHHRSRFAPLGAPEAATVAGVLAGDGGARLSTPAVAFRSRGLTPSSRTVLRC